MPEGGKRVLKPCVPPFPPKKMETLNGENFKFSKQREQEDVKENLSDEHRTTKEITKAMSSLVYFLRFTGKDGTMFPDGKLPTLDTALWVSDGVVKHVFFEKSMVGNQVLYRDTVLPNASLRSTLLQETVRCLLNTSVDAEVEMVRDVFSRYAQK